MNLDNGENLNYKENANLYSRTVENTPSYAALKLEPADLFFFITTTGIFYILKTIISQQFDKKNLQ